MVYVDDIPEMLLGQQISGAQIVMGDFRSHRKLNRWQYSISIYYTAIAVLRKLSTGMINKKIISFNFFCLISFSALL